MRRSPASAGPGPGGSAFSQFSKPTVERSGVGGGGRARGVGVVVIVAHLPLAAGVLAAMGVIGVAVVAAVVEPVLRTGVGTGA